MNITKDHLPWEKNRYLWVCPECGAINAWDSNDVEKAESMLKTEVHVCHGSCFDNVCGNCGVDIVEPDSPILAQCYSHIGE